MSQQNQKQLVVTDDEPDFRKFVRRVAEKAGWNVVECANGRELADMISVKPNPSLVILDLAMPEMDGFQSLDWLADNTPSVPVCIVTGGPLTDVKPVAGTVSGAKSHIRKTLSKPILIDDLREVLDFADF